MGKLKNQFTVNFDDDTAKAINDLARLTQRKPAELLRLLATPVIYDALAKACYLGSKSEPAHFVPGVLPGDSFNK